MKKIKYADGKFSQQCLAIKKSYYFERNCGVRFQYADIENLLIKQKESKTKRLNILLGCGCNEKRATILFYLNLFCFLCRQTNRDKDTVQIIERLKHDQLLKLPIQSHTNQIAKQGHQNAFAGIFDLWDYESLKGILQEIQEKDQEFMIPKVQILNLKDDKNEFFMECFYCHSIMKGIDIDKLLNFQWETSFSEFACLICIHNIKIGKQIKHKQKQKKASLKDTKNRQNQGQFQQFNPNFEHRLSQKNSPLENFLKQKPLYSTRIKKSKFMRMLDFFTNPEFTYTGKGLPQLDPDIFNGKL